MQRELLSKHHDVSILLVKIKTLHTCISFLAMREHTGIQKRTRLSIYFNSFVYRIGKQHTHNSVASTMLHTPRCSCKIVASSAVTYYRQSQKQCHCSRKPVLTSAVCSQIFQCPVPPTYTLERQANIPYVPPVNLTRNRLLQTLKPNALSKLVNLCDLTSSLYQSSSLPLEVRARKVIDPE